MHRFFMAISLILIVTFFSIQAHAADKDIVAKIGNRTIVMADLDKLIAYASAEKQKVIQNNPQLKEDLLKQFVQSIVLSDLARKKGFDQLPEIKERLGFYMDSILANEFLRKEVSDRLTLSEEEKLQYYKNHQDEFRVPDMVKAKHILISVDKAASSETREKAREKAVDILQRLQAGEDFEKLVSNFSDDSSAKTKGGDMGFVPRGKLSRPFDDAAFSLNPGEISNIIETQHGFEIIKIEEKKASYSEPYDAVKDRIAQKNLQEKMQSTTKEFIEKAMKDAEAVVYPEAISGKK